MILPPPCNSLKHARCWNNFACTACLSTSEGSPQQVAWCLGMPAPRWDLDLVTQTPHGTWQPEWCLIFFISGAKQNLFIYLGNWLAMLARFICDFPPTSLLSQRQCLRSTDFIAAGLYSCSVFILVLQKLVLLFYSIILNRFIPPGPLTSMDLEGYGSV